MAWIAGAHGSSGPQPGRPVDMRAPSWSWASIEGAVDHCTNFEDEFWAVCDVALVRTGPENCDSFSNIEWAMAGMRIRLVPATLEVRKHEAKGEDPENSISFDYTCTIAEQRYTMYPDSLLKIGEDGVERSTTSEQEAFSYPVTALACLVVRIKGPNMSDDDNDNVDKSNIASKWRLEFLILHCYESEETHIPYQRIGILPFVGAVSLPEG